MTKYVRIRTYDDLTVMRFRDTKYFGEGVDTKDFIKFLIKIGSMTESKSYAYVMRCKK